MAEELVNLISNLIDSKQYSVAAAIPYNDNYHEIFKEHGVSLIPMLLNKIDSNSIVYSFEKDGFITNMFTEIINTTTSVQGVLKKFLLELESVEVLNRPKFFFMILILPMIISKIPKNELDSSFDECFKSLSALLHRVPPVENTQDGRHYNSVNVACTAFIYSHLPKFLSMFTHQLSHSEYKNVKKLFIEFVISLFGESFVQIDYSEQDFATLGMKPSIIDLMQQLHVLEPDFAKLLDNLEMSAKSSNTTWSDQANRVNLTSLSGVCFAIFSNEFVIPPYVVPTVNDNNIHKIFIAVHHLLLFDDFGPVKKGLALGIKLLSCLSKPLLKDHLQSSEIYSEIFHQLLSLTEETKNKKILEGAKVLLNMYINAFEDDGRQQLLDIQKLKASTDGNCTSSSTDNGVKNMENLFNINEQISSLLDCGKYNNNKYAKAVNMPFDAKYSEDFKTTCLDLIPILIRKCDNNTLFNAPGLHSACVELLSTIIIKSEPQHVLTKLNSELEIAENFTQVTIILTHLQSILKNLPLKIRGSFLNQCFSSINAYINTIPIPERNSEGLQKTHLDVNVLNVSTLYCVLPKFYMPFVDELTMSDESKNIKKIISAFLISLFGNRFLHIEYSNVETKAPLKKQSLENLKLICKLEPDLSIFGKCLVNCYKEKKNSNVIMKIGNSSPYDERDKINLSSLSGLFYVLFSDNFDIPKDLLPDLEKNDVLMHKAVIAAYHLMTFDEYGPLSKGVSLAIVLFKRFPRNLPSSLLQSPDVAHLDLFREASEVLKRCRYKKILDVVPAIFGEVLNRFDIDGRQLLLSLMLQNGSIGSASLN